MTNAITTRTTRWLLFVVCLVATLPPFALASSGDKKQTEDATGDEPFAFEEEEPGVAVLFPWFTVAIGSVVFFFITRFAEGIPYTTVMFLIGTFIGIGNARKTGDTENFLHESVSVYWREIDAEVLLLCFLPGLIFKDAWSLDSNLFAKAFPQMLNFAFPMVLGGMFLTALVARYILPYDDWSWDFCFMFGSILAATDPVAVAALLETVGAPPRLKVHISGEALMNDGAAIVFYTIFSQRYLLELGVPGLGQDIDWGQGFKLFFQMSVGGAAIGIGFGFATLVFMHLLKRRLDHEENVVEVSTCLAAAYLCYFVAEVVLETSGVIATLSMGLIINEFGRPTINDVKLMRGVWSIVEHVLNTVLFTLGGLVWGSVISNAGDSHASFSSRDWGYLFVLYALLHVIRFVLFALFYPATSRMGLKTCIQEQSFQIFGGLRGAVGIALAIAIDNTVEEATEQAHLDLTFIQQTSKLFGHIGGVAFLTLCINATLAGPLLRKLGLADMTNFRKNILAVVVSRLRMAAVDKTVALLAKPWFTKIDFKIVQNHVSALHDVYLHEVIAAAKRYENTNHHKPWYSAPNLKGIIPHLKVDPLKSYMSRAEEDALLKGLKHPKDGRGIRQDTHHSVFDEAASGETRHPRPRRLRQTTHDGVLSDGAFNRSEGDSDHMPPQEGRMGRIRPLSHLGALLGSSHKSEDPGADNYTLEESRRMFLEVLRAEYERLIDNGNLARQEDLNYVLLTSIDFCADSVNKGGKLNDWEFVRKFRGAGFAFKNLGNFRLLKLWLERKKNAEETRTTAREISVRFEVALAIGFLEAHTRARRVFSEEFAEVKGDMSDAELQVMKESEDECKHAEFFLSSLPEDKVRVYVSHIFSIILLNKLVKYIESLANASFLKDTEAEEFLEDIHEELSETNHCFVQYYSKRRNQSVATTTVQLAASMIPRKSHHGAMDAVDEEQPSPDTTEEQPIVET